MNSEPIIRFANETDIDDIIKLCEAHAIFERSKYQIDGKKENLTKNLFCDSPSLYCLVVELENKLVGYSTFMKQFSTWEAEHYFYMDCLFLNEESRGYGLGEKLLDKIKSEAKKLNCKHIQWQTPEFNKRAIKFYNRIGANSKSKERFFLDV